MGIIVLKLLLILFVIFPILCILLIGALIGMVFASDVLDSWSLPLRRKWKKLPKPVINKEDAEKIAREYFETTYTNDKEKQSIRVSEGLTQWRASYGHWRPPRWIRIDNQTGDIIPRKPGLWR